RALVVDGAREQLLARPRFAEEQNGLLRLCSALELREERAHHERRSERVAETRRAREGNRPGGARHAQKEPRAPDRHLAVRRKQPLYDLRSSEHSSVLASEVAHEDSAFGEREGAMSARDSRILDDEVCVRILADDDWSEPERRVRLATVGRKRDDLERG